MPEMPCGSYWMRNRVLLLLLVGVFLFAGQGHAELRKSLREVALALSDSVPLGFKVGVAEFTPAGEVRKGSLFGLAVADLLATELAEFSRGRFTVVERAHLAKLVKDSEFFGADDPDSRLKLSKAGVQALVVGTYLPSGEGVLLSARLIRVEDWRVLGGRSETIRRDAEIGVMLAREFPTRQRTSEEPLDSPLVEAGLFYLAPNRKLFPVREGIALYRHDNYRVYFRPNERSYVYVLQVDADGEVFRLFPNPEGRWGYRTAENPVEKETWVPEPPRFLYLDEKTGREELFVFASKGPIPEFEGTITGKRVQETIKLMGPGGSRVVPVEVKGPQGNVISYETLRARVNARGDLLYQVWFWHR